MKKLALTTALLAMSASSYAELSGSAGYVTDYVYRGTTLGDAGAYVGGEYSASGFTIGVWGIQDSGVGVDGATSSVSVSRSGGVEADVYASYTYEFNDDFSASLGATTYNYTYRDGNEVEGNLGLGLGPVAVDYAQGKINPDGEGDSTDYSYVSIAGEAGPVSVTVGAFDLDSEAKSDDYTHLDVSFGTEFKELAVSASITMGVKQPGGDKPKTEEYLFLDVSKAF